MSGEFKPVPLTKLPSDPYKHVRYVDGMVLGVDDFEQEFAYLSERDKLLVRMLAGYGIVRGLRVLVRQAGADGPEVVVTAGLGITPSGDVLRVPVDQCAVLQHWMTGGSIVPPGNDPDERQLVAYIVAEYATRTSDPVPIPGEPCRTENEVLADSRIADAFRLTLSVDVPTQPEEDALRAYLRWVGAMPDVDTGGVSIDEIKKAIVRAAWQKTDTNTNQPPAPLGDDEPLVFGSHPQGPGGVDLEANRHEAIRAYLGGLEKLADVRALSAVLESSVTGGLPRDANKEAIQLILAKMTIPTVQQPPASNVWVPKTADGSDIVIDDSIAPRLLPLRFLLRAALDGLQRVADAAVTQPRRDRRYMVAAAGKVEVKADEASATPSTDGIGGLRAWTTADGSVTVDFQGVGVISSDDYVVKAISSLKTLLGGAGAVIAPQVNVNQFTALNAFELAVTQPDGTNLPQDELAGLKLWIEVNAIVG